MRKTFRYRIYPTRVQVQFLEHQLREACFLYNAALQERRDHWKQARKSISYYDQANQLKEIRSEGLTGLANFSCCQEVLRRLDKAFKAFFARVKRGDTPGFPRFKASRSWDSITFPSYGDGCKLLDNGKLRLQGAGQIKVKLHRPIEGIIKTVTVCREASKWYVAFSVELEGKPLPESKHAVGLDVGLESFAVTSDGEVIANPRLAKQAEARLRVAQRRVARRKKGSTGRRKAVVLLQKAHVHVRNQRTNFHHQVAHGLVKTYGLIAIEKLNIQGLASGMLAKAVHDVGWSNFFQILAHKAESAGRKLIEVDPRGTSQRCSQCGETVTKTLRDRWHECPACGFSAHRDHNSALEILRLGLSRVAPTWGSGPCVATEAAAF